jgi:hypothetical protein
LRASRHWRQLQYRLVFDQNARRKAQKTDVYEFFHRVKKPDEFFVQACKDKKQAQPPKRAGGSADMPVKGLREDLIRSIATTGLHE